MQELGLELTVAGVRLITGQSSTLRRVHTSQVQRVIAVESCEIPVRTEAII